MGAGLPDLVAPDDAAGGVELVGEHEVGAEELAQLAQHVVHGLGELGDRRAQQAREAPPQQLLVLQAAGQQLLGVLEAGDVGGHAEHLGRLAAPGVEAGVEPLHPALVAGGVDGRHARVTHLAPGGDDAPAQGEGAPGGIRIGGRLQHVGALELVGRVAQERGRRRVDQAIATLVVAGVDEVGQRVEHMAQVGALAFAGAVGGAADQVDAQAEQRDQEGAPLQHGGAVDGHADRRSKPMVTRPRTGQRQGQQAGQDGDGVDRQGSPRSSGSSRPALTRKTGQHPHAMRSPGRRAPRTLAGSGGWPPRPRRRRIR